MDIGMTRQQSAGSLHTVIQSVGTLDLQQPSSFFIVAL